jgi:hypothetical protein
MSSGRIRTRIRPLDTRMEMEMFVCWTLGIDDQIERSFTLKKNRGPLLCHQKLCPIIFYSKTRIRCFAHSRLEHFWQTDFSGNGNTKLEDFRLQDFVCLCFIFALFCLFISFYLKHE